MIVATLGNTDLLKLPKTAFLCSRVSATLNERLFKNLQYGKKENNNYK